MEKRLKDWKTHGFDTHGFTLAQQISDSHLPPLEGQSRAVHPDPEDDKRERADGTYCVNIPDGRNWVCILPERIFLFQTKPSVARHVRGAKIYASSRCLAFCERNTDSKSLQEVYVNHLKENKLRALGVDEQIQRNSPATSVMSRQGSSQSSAALTSPALASSLHVGPFPISFYGAAKPATYTGKPGDSHCPRYSMAHPSNEPCLVSPNQYFQPDEPHMPGTWSPQTDFASQQGSRAASPGVNGHMPTFGHAALSASPVATSNVGQVSNQASLNLLARMREQQALLQIQQLQQQQHHHQQQVLQPRSLPSLGISQNQERILQPVLHHNQAEIPTPIPRGHRQNQSENLQTGVDEDEARVSYSLDENEGRESSKAAQDDEGYDEYQAKNLPNNIGRAAPQNAKANVSVLDASLNIEGMPDHETNHPEQCQSRYSSKASQLNVNAPKFEPRISKGSGVFSFLGTQRARKVTETESLSYPSSNGAMQAPNEASQPSKWNVAAPAFMPKTSVTATIPSREFSFSASRPSFRLDAPAFKPSESGNASGPEPASEQNTVQPVKKIFGEVNFSEVIKPLKSKAIPITKPKKDLESRGKSGGDMEGQEDESGRITQADGRQKRMRYVPSEVFVHIRVLSLLVAGKGLYPCYVTKTCLLTRLCVMEFSFYHTLSPPLTAS